MGKSLCVHDLNGGEAGDRGGRSDLCDGVYLQ